MIDSIGSTRLGAAVALTQARAQADFSVAALKNSAEMQDNAMAALLQGTTAPAASGSRGQSVDILV